MKKSYSLSTLFFLMVILAQALTIIVMLREVRDARAELELNRRRFGAIRVNDESKTYIAHIPDPNESFGTSYRVRVPAGSRYLLHLSDTTFSGAEPPKTLVSTTSISLNGWRDGADVVLSFNDYWENNSPRINVHTEQSEYFNYVPPDWKTGGQIQSWHLETDPQNEYSTDETIPFMWWRDSVTKRTIVLWLEPHSTWNDRRLREKAAIEEGIKPGSE